MAAAEASDGSSLWLEAHNDPLAGLRPFPGCMALADLHGDGDHKLVVGVRGGAGGPGRDPPLLSIVGGAGSVSSLTLPAAPAGLGVFGGVAGGGPGGGGGGGAGGGGGGSLLVAAGPSLFVYRNLRPFYKFTLPPPRDPPPPGSLERELWGQADTDQIDPLTLRELLEDLRVRGEEPLTARSLRLLALPPPQLAQFVAQHRGQPLQHQTVITCLGALPRGGPDGTPPCPLLGTEGGALLLLDPEAFSPLCQLTLPSPPAFLAPRGPPDGNLRMAAACRDGSVWGGDRSRSRPRQLLPPGPPPAGLLAQPWGLLVATARGELRGLSARGRHLWLLRLPGGVSALGGGDFPGGGGGALVALEPPGTPQIRLYRGRTLLCTLSTQDVVAGLCFGRYGREDQTLVTCGRGGGLSIRILRRRAELGSGPAPSRGPAPLPPLPLPPRSRLLAAGGQREREGAVGLHQRFQRELGGLRLGAARALLRGLGGAGAAPSAPPLTLTATVQGLGSRLRLTLRLLLPGGGPPTPDLRLLLLPPGRPPPAPIKVPLLLPGVSCSLGTWLEPGGGRLQVLVLRRGSESPVLTAQLGLPPALGASQ